MIKLYLDEDVHKRIALSLRLKGYDVISAHEVRNHGIPDYEQLEYAISEERAIFTFSSLSHSSHGPQGLQPLQWSPQKVRVSGIPFL